MKVLNTSGPTQPQITGNELLFPAVNQLPPAQKLSYSVVVQALEPGDVRFHVELRSTELKEEVVEEESTTIYAVPVGPSSPRPAPAGTPPPGGTPTTTAPPPAALGKPPATGGGAALGRPQ
jgi:hypothetical protein